MRLSNFTHTQEYIVFTVCRISDQNNIYSGFNTEGGIEIPVKETV